jgi:UDP-2,3-diacylglucosamine pyrophosphatase LpxH
MKKIVEALMHLQKFSPKFSFYSRETITTHKKWTTLLIIMLTTDVQHKIIHKKFSLKREILLMLSKIDEN